MIAPSSETWTRQAVEPIRLTKTVPPDAPSTLCDPDRLPVNPNNPSCNAERPRPNLIFDGMTGFIAG
jgi:hypothetical protein